MDPEDNLAAGRFFFWKIVFAIIKLEKRYLENSGYGEKEIHLLSKILYYLTILFNFVLLTQ